MNIMISDRPIALAVYGISGVADNHHYTGTAVKLMDKVWQIIKAEDLKHKGKNIWIYESDHIFTGVELSEKPKAGSALLEKNITILKHAYCKHIGSYNLIQQTGIAMSKELRRRNLDIDYPYIEIYGHWQNDESKLETELIMAIR